MSKQPLFEELDQRWSDLPLPDADASWKDMSALLDEEDRKRVPPILPTFLSGCAGWTLVMLVLSVGAIGLYWHQQRGETSRSTPHIAAPATGAPAPKDPVAYHPAPSNESESSPTQTPNNSTTTGSSAATPAETAPSAPKRNPNPAADQMPANPTAVATKEEKSTHQNTRSVTPVSGRSINEKRARNSTVVEKIENSGPRDRPAGAVAQSAPGKRTKMPKSTDGAVAAARPIDPGSAPKSPDSSETVARAPLQPKTAPAPVPIPQAAAPPGSDSVSKTVTVAVPLPVDSLAIAKSVEAARKKAGRAPWFSAGVGISQAIPVGDQQNSAYNYQGKSNLLSEHVPSAWLRMHKGRWFLQGEARFNAPQLVPDFAFAQKTRYDTAAHAVQTDRQQLRKAWYHQFPLTANYQVLPRLSVGAGMQWSVLYRAAGERSSVRRILGTSQVQESAAGFQVPGYRDSFLYKSQWQFVLQTEWSWRRWGLGLRYRADLEPFMRYTKPDGEVLDVRNEAFEATLRFRLWQSKRRK